MSQIRGISFPKESNTKNHIINGNFDFWQRNTSFTGAASNSYSADRHSLNLSIVGGTVNVTRDTSVPNEKSNFSIKYTHATATATTVTEYSNRYKIERQDSRRIFSNQVVTLSFWYMSNKTGDHGVRLDNGVGTGVTGQTNTSLTFNIPVANTWTYITKTVTMNITSFGSDAENSLSGFVEIGFKVSGAGFSTVNVADYFQISQVMLNEGPVAAPFALFTESTESEIAACQRYYEKTYDLDTAVGSSGVTIGVLIFPTSSVANGGTYIPAIRFAVQKRAIPSVTIRGFSGGTSVVSNGGGTDLAANSGSANFIGMSSFRLFNNSGGTITTAEIAHWIADAEL
jgi:hypothetical protein